MVGLLIASNWVLCPAHAAKRFRFHGLYSLGGLLYVGSLEGPLLGVCLCDTQACSPGPIHEILYTRERIWLGDWISLEI